MLADQQPTIVDFETIVRIAAVFLDGSLSCCDPQCVYATCKHGLRGWSLSCHEALRNHGVKVVVIEPGACCVARV